LKASHGTWLVAILAAVTILASIGCGGSKSITQMTAQELFERGKDRYEREKYFSAIESFQACIYNYPGKTIVDTAQYYLGLTYFANKEYEVAQVEFNRLTMNYPGSVYFENAIFMRAACYFHSAPNNSGLDQQTLHTAIQLLEDFIMDFPESESVPDAHNYLEAARTRLARKSYESGVVYSRMGARESAKNYYQYVIDEFTDTDYGADAAYMYAEQEMKLRRYAEARIRFEGFVAAFPDHKWAPKAVDMITEAAFLDAQYSFENTPYAADLRQKLTGFQTDFPDSDHVDKISEYLKDLPPEPVDSSQGENAGS
jgi:outer membrane protein assembly factor BamD